jgi:hypothetical protein
MMKLIVGFMMMRYVWKIEPIASLPDEVDGPLN